MIKPYTKTFVCELTGIKTTYTYNGASIVTGMIKAEFEYPKEYLDEFNKKEKRQSNLPKTKQMFLNPATGKEVGYYRAKNLGLVK
tara:strand:- start:92 stop:346 length:255 start_codon:yes stop_codon:yes gene_type:complete